MSFLDLPKSIKEEIFDYFSIEELCKLRMVNKEWKSVIENANSLNLKHKTKEAKERGVRYHETKKFYHDFPMTLKLLRGSTMGLECCYGRVYDCTLRWTGCCFLYPIQCYRDNNSFWLLCVCCPIFFLSFPFNLLLMFLSYFVEFLKLFVWLITFCHCCKTNQLCCKCRNVGGISKLATKGGNAQIFDSKPPFPTKSEIQVLLREGKVGRFRSILSLHEEEIPCSVACAICMGGNDCTACIR